MATKLTPTKKKVAEIHALLKAEGWTEVKGTEYSNANTWPKQVASHTSILALVHPTSKLGFCLGKNKTRFGGTRAGFFQARPDEKGNYTYMCGANSVLRSPGRWYVIGPITGWKIDTANKLITNKEGNVAVAYGI